MEIIKKLNGFLVFFMLSTATILPFYYYKFQAGDEIFTSESSVWCFENSSICKFKNVCFSPEFRTLLFFFGNKSIIKGVLSYKNFQNIQLSSIKDHNQFFANISIVDPNNFVSTSSIQVIPKVFVFARFKPNNIMHVLHDDLFPLFLTLEYVCSGDKNCMQSFRLVMHDGFPKGPFFNMYELFSNNPPFLLSAWDQCLCFKEMLIGLVQDSVFYQYGFNKPHGPVKPEKLSQNDVLRFTSFIKEKLDIKEKNEKADIVVFNRQKNRKILNIENLMEMVLMTSQKINKNIKSYKIFDLHTDGITALIKSISSADILIGMHGAEMIFSLFMKPKSIIIELFPFGIQPNFVSFIKPLSQIEGSHLYYIPWRNHLKNNSVPYPNTHPLFGGIAHLPKATQEEIMNAIEVPPVKCCNDPLYLYYMYQDTWVSDDFKIFLNKSLTDYEYHIKNSERNMNKWFYPSAVVDVTCEFVLGNKIIIKWQPPFNVQNKYLIYSLYLKDRNNKFKREFLTNSLLQEIELPNGIVSDIQGWIFAIYEINNSKSHDSYFECKKK